MVSAPPPMYCSSSFVSWPCARKYFATVPLQASSQSYSYHCQLHPVRDHCRASVGNANDGEIPPSGSADVARARFQILPLRRGSRRSWGEGSTQEDEYGSAGRDNMQNRDRGSEDRSQEFSPSAYRNAATPGVIFACGGTGGHVFPALAVADVLASSGSNSSPTPPPIAVFGSSSRIEATVIPNSTLPLRFHTVPAVAPRRPLFSLGNFLLPFKLAIALIVAWIKLGKLGFKPRVLFGTGGYVAFPVCAAAAVRGIKIVLLEPNAVAGLANKILCRLFRAIVFVTSANAVQSFASSRADVRILPAAPVRRGMAPATETARRTAISEFFPQSTQSQINKVILVLGGSQGSKPVNEAVLEAVPELSRLPGLGILWQVGGKNYKKVVEDFDSVECSPDFKSRVKIIPFIDSMNTAYAACDFVVCRAGAITCAELVATGTPGVLIPARAVTDNHQYQNAKELLSRRMVHVVDESKIEEIRWRIFRVAVDADDLRYLKKMALIEAQKFAVQDSSTGIANLLLEYLNR